MPVNYPFKTDSEKIAVSSGINLRVSHKNSIEICTFITGKKVKTALDQLEKIINKENAMPYKRFVTHQAHRKGKMRTGRYPVNAAIEVVKLLENASNNAENKGFNTDNIVIKNAQANRGGNRFYRGRRAFGRRFSKTTNIYITVEEVA